MSWLIPAPQHSVRYWNISSTCYCQKQEFPKAIGNCSRHLWRTTLRTGRTQQVMAATALGRAVDLQKSGIMAFELVSELVYGKQHDHTVRQAAKQGAVEALMEHENVKELWSQVQSQLANEAAERLALQKGQNAEAESEPEEEVVLIRKNPQSFALHSPSYWRAVANASVRTYVSVMPEPKTTDGVAQAISQCNLKSIRGNLGESCILQHLDLVKPGVHHASPFCENNSNLSFNCCQNCVMGPWRPEVPRKTMMQGRPLQSWKETLLPSTVEWTEPRRRRRTCSKQAEAKRWTVN